ncbi:hypothetical protein NQZ68_022309 [Dissostichus eleginoides]|nr:hypothetical protein NQZ68_022309 [Dissostichus eleginoides]
MSLAPAEYIDFKEDFHLRHPEQPSRTHAQPGVKPGGKRPLQTRGYLEEEGEASSVEEDEDFQEREAERASSDEY